MLIAPPMLQLCASAVTEAERLIKAHRVDAVTVPRLLLLSPPCSPTPLTLLLATVQGVTDVLMISPHLELHSPLSPRSKHTQRIHHFQLQNSCVARGAMYLIFQTSSPISLLIPHLFDHLRLIILVSYSLPTVRATTSSFNSPNN